MPPEGRFVLLVAGFFDGFVGRQSSAPAISTIGANLPLHLVSDLAGRRVAVAYDVGEEDASEATVARLRRADCEAWVVRLGKLGLPPGGDLSDWYLGGGTTAALLRLIRVEGRAGR